MSEEIEYPSKERERAKVNVKVSAEVNTYLHDLYNQIQYEFCEQYEDEIKDLQKKVEQLENIRKEAIEYVTSYESISTIQGLDAIEKNKILDEKTMNEMVNRYLKVHDILLNILNKGDNNGK